MERVLLLELEDLGSPTSLSLIGRPWASHLALCAGGLVVPGLAVLLGGSKEDGHGRTWH